MSLLYRVMSMLKLRINIKLPQLLFIAVSGGGMVLDLCLGGGGATRV